MTAAGGAVPFARAVVIVRGFDGDMEKDRLHVAVQTAPSSDQTRARQRYRALSHYVAATFIGAFFPVSPLSAAGKLRSREEQVGHFFPRVFLARTPVNAQESIREGRPPTV